MIDHSYREKMINPKFPIRLTFRVNHRAKADLEIRVSVC